MPNRYNNYDYEKKDINCVFIGPAPVGFVR